MTNVNDLFRTPQVLGRVGNSSQLAPGGAVGPGYFNQGQVVDAALDTVWSRGYSASQNKALNSDPYFDYYYSGADIVVTVDGTEDDPRFGQLPIINLAWSIMQQKQPLYGFWDYTYAQMMRGTRIVQGAFSIATTYPNFIRDLIAKSAQTRQAKGTTSYSYFKGLTEDDKNIEQYWGKNIDPSIATMGADVYSVHPPFSFVVIYGVQDVTVSNLPGQFDAFASNNPMATDTNDRLVQSDPIGNTDRIVIDSVEICGMSTGYDTSGAVVSENYQFLARDVVWPGNPV